MMMNSAAAAAAAASSTRAYDYDGDHSHIAVATNADTAIETASTNNGDCVNVLQRPVDAVNSNTTHLDAEVKMNGAKAAEDRKRQEQAESDDSSIRGKKHFPRVRVLISNKEFEDFLMAVLDALDESGAPKVANAGNKDSNPWYKAFDSIYHGVAREYIIPSGKNRYQKFQDKIVQLWNDLEKDVDESHPCRIKAMQQLTTFRQVCANAECAKVLDSTQDGSSSNFEYAEDLFSTVGNKTSQSRDEASSRGSSPLPPAPVSQPNSKNKKFRVTKRTLPRLEGHWSGLHVQQTLSKLPEPLQSLLNLRELGKEMTNGKATYQSTTSIDRPIEDVEDLADDGSTNIGSTNCRAGSKLEAAFIEALDEYIGMDLAPLENDKDTVYDRATCLALLHRCSGPTREEKERIEEAYSEAVDMYVALLRMDATTTTSQRRQQLQQKTVDEQANSTTGVGV